MKSQHARAEQRVGISDEARQRRVRAGVVRRAVAWLRGPATPDSCDWLRELSQGSRHSPNRTLAIERHLRLHGVATTSALSRTALAFSCVGLPSGSAHKADPIALALGVPDAWIRPVIAEQLDPVGRSLVEEPGAVSNGELRNCVVTELPVGMLE
jgi:hypothetical protein